MSDLGPVRALDDVLEELRRPLSEADLADGWDDAAVTNWRVHLAALRERMVAGEPPEHDQYRLMRWLNSQGIGAGPMAQRFDELQRVLWDHFASDSERREWESGTTGAEARRWIDEVVGRAHG